MYHGMRISPLFISWILHHIYIWRKCLKIFVLINYVQKWTASVLSQIPATPHSSIHRLPIDISKLKPCSIWLFGALYSLARYSRPHYNDVIMSAMVSQITSLTTVYSTVYSGADQRKHQSFASLAFVNSPRKWPVTREMFPFDNVIILFMEIPYGNKQQAAAAANDTISPSIMYMPLYVNSLRLGPRQIAINEWSWCFHIMSTT